MTTRIVAALTLVLAAACACRAAPDPLAEHRATCEKLQKAGQLKKGLALEDCAKRLKAVADAQKPPREQILDSLGHAQAEDLLENLAKAVSAARADLTKRPAVRDAVSALRQLGRPAIEPALAQMQSSIDGDFRAAIAEALSKTCAADCADKNFTCIVPAFLEQLREGLPAQTRHEAAEGLARCTGEKLGEDAGAWRKWWAGRKGAGANQAAR